METANIIFQKNALRKKMKDKLKSFCLDRQRVQSEAEKLANLFLVSTLYKESEIIFAYGATDLELSVDNIILEALKAGKKVALPKSCLKSNYMSFYFLDNHLDFYNQLVTGAYGIREPMNSLPCADKFVMEQQVVFLVPGVAFSKKGERLGHGKGYYDNYFERICIEKNSSVFLSSLVGICYDFQLLDSIPVEPHDKKVAEIFTPYEIKKNY